MSRYSLKSELSVTSIDNESVLLDTQTGQYYGLNEVGTLIIDGLQRKLSLAAIEDQITANFTVSQSQAQADIHTLVDELVTAGLLISDKTSTPQ